MHPSSWKRISVVNALPYAVRIDDLIEQSVVAFVQAPAIEAKRRGGQSNNFHIRVDHQQRVDELPVHRVAVVWNQLNLVDRPHVNVPELRRLVINRL